MKIKLNIFSIFVLALILFSLMGNEACRKDVGLGTQSNVTVSSTATSTVTTSATATATATSTSSASSTVTPSTSASSSATATATTSASSSSTNTSTATTTATATVTSAALFSTPTLAMSDNLRSVFESLSNKMSSSEYSKKILAGSNEFKHITNGNWLGKNYSNETTSDLPLDSDNDGFSDELEKDLGTSSNSETDFPKTFTTSLALRLGSIDSDLDGLSNQDEVKYGTKKDSLDTDGDRASDGAEVLSGTNPVDFNSKPHDPDGDGLPSEFEIDQGIDQVGADTDRDGLWDDAEFAIGTNPRDVDSDNDGIFDGREFFMGSDPIQAEGSNLSK